MNILIYNNINTPEIYLSELEQQYVMLIMRYHSLSETIDVNFSCPKCSEINKINCDIKESISYKQADYPVKDEKYDINYVDIMTQKSLDDEIAKFFSIEDNDDAEYTSEGDIEVAMHISKQGKSPQEVLTWLDNVSLKEFTEIMNNLQKAAPNMIITKKDTCHHCQELVEFETNTLPNIFDDLVE